MTTFNSKTRMNYSTGGWCGKTDCTRRGHRCGRCFKFSEYKPSKKRKARQ